MAAVDLPPPALSHLHLSVARRGAVSDHKMIRHPILHLAHATVIVIEGAGVSLSCPAVVHDDELPAGALHRRTADRLDHAAAQITVVRCRFAPEHPRPETAPRRRGGGRFKPL